MSLFLVLFIVACLGLWIGAEVVSYLRAKRDTRPLRSRPELRIVRTDHVAERKRAISHRGFKSRMGAR